MKLKIAVLGVKGIPHPGGIELVMEEIGSRLVKKGHQVDIFVRKHYMKDKPFNIYKGMGLPLSKGIHSKNLDAITHSISALIKILSGGYNVVYFNSVGLSTLSWIPRVFGMKTVVHTHGLDWKREKWGKIAKKLIRFSAYTSVEFPNLTLCVCLEDKRFLETTYGKHCFYIPNGTPYVVVRQPELITQYGLKGRDYFLFMSRLVPEKGCHFLLRAWQKLSSSQKKGMKLVIAGDSNHRDQYYYSLLEHKSLPDVIFTGFATGDLKEELLSNAYCFVQPSTIEGLPLSILEALAYGIYVLASDIQENKDAIQDCGATFQCGNSDDLGSKIEEIINMSPDIIEREMFKAREFAKKEYNWEQITDKVEGLLLDLVK
ncbi:MAG: glycosyltransferase family 4 protein [Nitrospirae bacterium]|nr:glycosyltransferase family 4 protein [Nitrospirota bacterium]